VVPAGAQPADPVIDLAERADDQDGCRDPTLPQLLHDSNSVEVGKHSVDCDHGVAFRAPAFQRVVASHSDVHLVPVHRKRFEYLPCCFGIILNYQNVAAGLHAQSVPSQSSRHYCSITAAADIFVLKSFEMIEVGCEGGDLRLRQTVSD
jgi:hypothetical protein